MVRTACIEGRSDDDAFRWQWQAHAFQHDCHADNAVAIFLEQVIEKLREMKQCRDPVRIWRKAKPPATILGHQTRDEK